MGDRGMWNQEKVVYSETFKVKGQNGEVADGEIAYRIVAAVHAFQEGNATFPDNRSCHFKPVMRELRRTITVTPPGKPPANLGTKIVALPVNGIRDFNDDCDAVMGGIHSFVAEQLGDRQRWSKEINSDADDVRAILEILGLVTDRQVVN